MPTLADDVALNLHKLIGLKLSRMARAGSMRTLEFGNTEPRLGGGVVGQYALHIQCPWRLDSETAFVTGSGDLYEPYEQGDELREAFDWETGDNLQDKVLRDVLQGYDESTKQIVNATNFLTVEDVETDSAGGFRLKLSGGYRLSVFPDSARGEAWRMFRPRTDGHESTERHFVIPVKA